MSENVVSPWWARGLLFESCNCRVVCPGHVHFDQRCTFERCIGYWAVRFDEGELEGVSLGGAKAVIAYNSPQHMIEGNWTQLTVLDARAEDQVAPLEAILTGAVGGPWSVLARFVSRRLETLRRPIRIDDEDRVKRVTIDGMLDSRIEAIRGRDRRKPVTFENMFNQIHSTSQVIARGNSHYDDGEIAFDAEGTHALYSAFHWSVSAE